MTKFSNNDEEDDDNANDQRFDTVRLGEVDQVLPSELLGSNLWRSNAVKLFNLHRDDREELKVDLNLPVNDENKSKADILVKLLNSRFNRFKKQQNAHKSRRTNWSMQFALDNFPVFAALMVLSRHLKMDLEFLNGRGGCLITDACCFTSICKE